MKIANETQLVALSILKMTDETQRNHLWNEFIKSFSEGATSGTVTTSKNIWRNDNPEFLKRIQAKKDREDFGQFENIADFINIGFDAMECYGYQKDLTNSDVIKYVFDQLKGVGIDPDSEEGLEFIEFLSERWRCKNASK